MPRRLNHFWVLISAALIGLCGGLAAGGAIEEPPVLSPREALATFRVPQGFKIELVVAEPELVNPITMTLDEQGQVYVSLAHTYRYGAERAPVTPPSNPIIRLELGDQGRVVRTTSVATGFSDPVMGLVVRDGWLWATNLNRVITAQIGREGEIGPPLSIVQDDATPWNPFGMYRLSLGRDGLLYMSVGEHVTKLTGRNNTVTVRGNTGGVFRFKSDGSDLELVAQGMRAPFSFDSDPYGELWVLSNGEGNPNRLIHAIVGADYHFQTRPVDWSWLAGKHPLAPPVWELPSGANTAVVAYYSAAFPEEYWGNLLVSNWGAHGFPSANHVIQRHVFDERGGLVKSEPILSSSDPRFRPTQLALAPDGNLYVLDWYGRDDENDLTGRLYKMSYVGSDNVSESAVTSRAGNAGLASRHHWTRQIARRELLQAGSDGAPQLAQVLGESNALAASEALWTLRQSGWPQAPHIMQIGLTHEDWRVRRLAIDLLRGQGQPPAQLQQLLKDPDPAVQLEAALCLTSPAERVQAVVQVLQAHAAMSPRLRYRAALEVARHGDHNDFIQLLTDARPEIRLAGLIALDEAFHENVRVDAARKALAELLSDPRAAPLTDLLALAQSWPHASLTPAVLAALARDLSAAETIAGVTVLRRIESGSTSDAIDGVLADKLDHFWHRVATAKVRLATRGDKLGALQLMALGRPSQDCVAVLEGLLRDEHAETRAAAHQVLTTIGVGDHDCAAICWKLLRDGAAPLEQRLETIVSLTQIEQTLPRQAWLDLLGAPCRSLSLVALRCLRKHADRTAAAEVLATIKPELAARGTEFEAAGSVRESPASIAALLERSRTTLEGADLDVTAIKHKDHLKARVLERLDQGDPLLGRLVFRSQMCQQCHQLGTPGEFLGPPLDGIAARNSTEYLIDSILYPSKVIKTGFMLERIVTLDGRILVGSVTSQADELLIRSLAGSTARVMIRDVEERQQLNRSLMPELLEWTMSEPELIDLITYLGTLRASPGPENEP